MLNKDPTKSLAKTDASDPASFEAALESVKKYVRAKIKKGKGREVSGPGGKLEQLEQEYAHNGFQDIFYLTRLHLSLPPSQLPLPPPSFATRRELLKHHYPLPLEYQQGFEVFEDNEPDVFFDHEPDEKGKRAKADAAAAAAKKKGLEITWGPKWSTVSPSTHKSATSIPRAGPSRGGVHTKPSASKLGPISLPLDRGSMLVDCPIPIQSQSSAMSSPSLNTPAQLHLAPPRPPPSYPTPSITKRTHTKSSDQATFTSESTLFSPIPVSPTLSVSIPSTSPRPQDRAHFSPTDTQSVLSPSVSEASIQSILESSKLSQRKPSEDEADVRRMLESRIKVLQAALNSLDAGDVGAMAQSTTSPPRAESSLPTVDEMVGSQEMESRHDEMVHSREPSDQPSLTKSSAHSRGPSGQTSESMHSHPSPHSLSTQSSTTRMNQVSSHSRGPSAETSRPETPNQGVYHENSIEIDAHAPQRPVHPPPSSDLSYILRSGDTPQATIPPNRPKHTVRSNVPHPLSQMTLDSNAPPNTNTSADPPIRHGPNQSIYKTPLRPSHPLHHAPSSMPDSATSQSSGQSGRSPLGPITPTNSSHDHDNDHDRLKLTNLHPDTARSSMDDDYVIDVNEYAKRHTQLAEHPPSIPLPPAPLQVSKSGRRGPPPPLNLPHSNLKQYKSIPALRPQQQAQERPPLEQQQKLPRLQAQTQTQPDRQQPPQLQQQPQLQSQQQRPQPQPQQPRAQTQLQLPTATTQNRAPSQIYQTLPKARASTHIRQAPHAALARPPSDSDGPYPSSSSLSGPPSRPPAHALAQRNVARPAPGPWEQNQQRQQQRNTRGPQGVRQGGRPPHEVGMAV